MTGRDAWLQAFPQPEAHAAVKALAIAWKDIAASRKRDFHSELKEPALTLYLKQYLRDAVSESLGLTGHWGAEDQGATIDYATGTISQRYRTDICYLWTGDNVRLDLVFEFKKLLHSETSRKNYYGASGMLRFITGPYSKRQPVALMVGILMENGKPSVAALRTALQQPAVAASLRAVNAAGKYVCDPSLLFPQIVPFDTEHVRDPAVAPAHGTIRIGHLFLGFGYPTKKEQEAAAKKKGAGI